MNITKDKVDQFFKDLGFSFPETPELALETSIAAIEKKPAVKSKVLILVEELKRKLNESGGNWDSIKNWVSSLFPSKNIQSQQVKDSSEVFEVRSKYAPLIQEEDVLSKVLYGLLSNIQKRRNILNEYEDVIKARSESKLKKLAVVLDAIADCLEFKGHIKEAYEIDKLSDKLEVLNIK